MSVHEPATKTVAYHQVHKTVIELWDAGGSLVALLPSGEMVSERNAAEVLNAVMRDDDTLVRKVTPRE